jgi:hypothetical protein
MPPFRFRLGKVLEWYRKQSELEGQRLCVCAERSARAKAEIGSYRRDVLARRTEIIRSSSPQPLELAALGPFLHAAKQRELLLREKCQKAEMDLEKQRGVSLAAQRRLLLFEKLRDRQLTEHDYEASRELEELASESYLAGFARTLSNEPRA